MSADGALQHVALDYLARAEKAEADVERLARRALDAEQGRDRAVAEELRLRALLGEAEASGWRQGMTEAHDSEMGQAIERLREALDLALGCKGSPGVCEHCREAIEKLRPTAARPPPEKT